MLNNQTLLSPDLQPSPIGIFDSGIGGLAMARALQQLIPEQTLIYIGDTAHCPWGDKSDAQIIEYSNKLTKFLVNHHCRIIIIACNTASCIAFSQLEKNFANTLIINVIDPTIKYLQQLNLNSFNNVGIIGTKQTIHSQTYQNLISSLYKQDEKSIDLDSTIKAVATPLLVPLIEEGLIDHPATDLILEEYLSKLDLANNSILILGCTHYPLIKDRIENYYNNLKKNIMIIDPATLTANLILNMLNQNNLRTNFNKTLNDNFYFTEDNGFFVNTAQRFFPDLNLQFLSLWE